MPNASTIRRQVAGTQQLTIASLTAAAISTTPTVFALNNNGLTLTGGGIIPLSAGVTGLWQGTGQQLWLHASVTVTGMTSASTTAILSLYVVPASSLPLASTVVSNANLVTAGATLIATSSTYTALTGQTSGTVELDAYLTLDAQGNLTGSFKSQGFNATFQAQVTLVTTTTLLTLVGEQDLNFALGFTFGGTATGAVATLNEFSLSLV